MQLLNFASRYAFGAANYVDSRTVLDYRRHFVHAVLPTLRRHQSEINVIELNGHVSVLRT